MTERLLKLPGFVYELEGKYYFLGKWICRECTHEDTIDCVFMYRMCRNSHEEQETALYYHKLRGYSDFALEIPHNPAKIRADMTALIDGLTEAGAKSLERQIASFEEDVKKYGAVA